MLIVEALTLYLLYYQKLTKCFGTTWHDQTIPHLTSKWINKTKLLCDLCMSADTLHKADWLQARGIPTQDVDSIIPCKLPACHRAGWKGDRYEERHWWLKTPEARELFCSLSLPSVSDQSNPVLISQRKDMLMSKPLEKGFVCIRAQSVYWHNRSEQLQKESTIFLLNGKLGVE